MRNAIEECYARIEAEPLRPIWISLVPRETALARADELGAATARPLRGLTFAVKDNIDVAGSPTTAGCPAFAYLPTSSATVVERLERAGAIVVGKTNLDQFATGLVGTRSPYGACSSVFDERWISGGSSSGSGVAVARGLVDFALGTDTAGSGRVPAAFNNLVGLKATRGLVSTRGVVPACRSLDCVSIFSRTCDLARRVLRVAQGFDAEDPFSRRAVATSTRVGAVRLGAPPAHDLEFFGDSDAQSLFDTALDRLRVVCGERVRIDFEPFRQAGDLLYEGPWVAERLAAIKPFVREHAADMDPVVRTIISGADRYSAVDAFEAMYTLQQLRRMTEAQWERMDVLVVPTTGTTYTHADIAADPYQTNSNLGYYTNFVNLLDLAAVAVPAGFRPNGLPSGISLIGQAFSDAMLLGVAERYLASAS